MISKVTYSKSVTESFGSIPTTGTSEHEIQWLCWAARNTPGNILEIGTQSGITTRNLAMACPDKLVFSVDLITDKPTMVDEQKHEMPTLRSVGFWARGLPNVMLSLQDSKTFSYTGKGIGFVFIDGDHSMDGVMADTALALAHYSACEKPMMIVWHDFYDHPWVAVKPYLESLNERGFDIKHVESTNIAYLSLP